MPIGHHLGFGAAHQPPFSSPYGYLAARRIEAAMRAYYSDTHNLAEGAGAAPLAALLKEKTKMAGKKVAVVLSGGNVDTEVYRAVLAGT